MGSINWKFKENAEPQGSSNGFWYDLTDGVYIDLESVLEDPKQILELQQAIDLLRNFEKALEENGLLNDF